MIVDDDLDTTSAIRPSIKVSTAANLIDCIQSQVRRLYYSGELEGHRVGKRGIRIYVDSLRAYQAHGAIGTPPQRKPPERKKASIAHSLSMESLRKAGCL